MRRVTCGVYQITSPSGKFYIGSSFDVWKRFSHHRRDLRLGRHHCSALQRAAEKYGLDALVFKLLIVCSRSEARFYEQRAIDALNPEYNSTTNTREPLSGLWKDPDFREAGRLRAARQHAKWRNDPEWMKRQKEGAAKALSALHKNPEFAAAHKARATERLCRLVNIPEVQERAAESRRARIAADMADPDSWTNRNAKIRELLEKPIRCVDTGEVFRSQVAAGEWLSRKHGFKTHRHISTALAGKKPMAYGYRWEFVKDGGNG